MDFVCAMLFHSNVNKVSPNRTILAGEKVGIAWLLPNEPGVDGMGFFPAFLGLWSLQVWACLHCSSSYTKPSVVKSTSLWRPSFQSCALDSWSWCPAPTTGPGGVSEVLQRCHKPIHVQQPAGAGPSCSEESGCTAALPGQPCQQSSTGSSSKVGCFQLLLFFTPIWCEL